MWRVEGLAWAELWERHQPYVRSLLRSSLSSKCGFLFPQSLIDACHLLHNPPQHAAIIVYNSLESGQPWQQQLPPPAPLELRALLFVFVSHLRSKVGPELKIFCEELTTSDAQWYAELLAWNPPPLREWKRPIWHAAELVRYLYLQFDAFMAQMTQRYTWKARVQQRPDLKAPGGTVHLRWQARGTYYEALITHFCVMMQLETNAKRWMRKTWPQGRFIRCYFANAFYRRCVTENLQPQVVVHWVLGAPLPLQ